MTAPFLGLMLQMALGRVAADGPPLRVQSSLAAALRGYSATPAEIVTGMVSARWGRT